MPFSSTKPRMRAVVRRRLRPDDEDVGDRGVGDPRLGAGQPVAAVHLLRPRPHAARIGAGVGLGQAEAADPLAGGELRQVLPALRVAAVGIDRIHDERGLHAHHRAIAGIDPLDLARDEPIGHVGRARAAELLRDRQRRAGRPRPSRGRCPGRCARPCSRRSTRGRSLSSAKAAAASRIIRSSTVSWSSRRKGSDQAKLWRPCR